MSNKLAKALKHKTDAMIRLQSQTQKPVVVEAADGSFSAQDPSDYAAALAAGKNIQILVSGNVKTIHAVMGIMAGNNISVSAPDPATGKVTVSGTISGKGINITDFTGKNGYALTYNSTLDKFELTQVASSYSLPLATETTLGGIKAKTRTAVETIEAAIDPGTGKMFVPAGGSGLPVGGTIGQILKKKSATDQDVLWANPPIILNSPGGIEVENFEGATFKFPTTTSGNWAKYAGGYNSANCMRAPDSSDTANLTFTVNVINPGKLSFYYKSSVYSGGADKTTLTIDGTTKKTYTGNVGAWTKDEVDITSGSHIIKFSRTAVYSAGFWLDDLTIPGSGQFDMDAVAQNPNSLLKVNSSGSNVGFVPATTFMESLSGAALPTAAVAYRGKIFTLLGAAGVADAAYICLKNAADTYAWIAI